MLIDEMLYGMNHKYYLMNLEFRNIQKLFFILYLGRMIRGANYLDS